MNPLTRILHLEDDALDAELIRATLESAGIVCQITRVQNRDEFTQALHQGEFDIIFADYRLPAYDGVSALRLAQELRPDLPCIFVSGTLGEDAAVDGLIQGATDYVLKQRLSRLVPAVERALRETENRRERQRAEEALQESESRYRLLAENASDIIFTIGLDLRFTYISPSVTRILGYTIEEAMAQTIDQVLTPASLERTLQVFTEELAIEASESKQLWRTRTLELEQICKGGSTIWTETTLAPLRDSESQAVGVIGITRDITERKQAEEALHLQSTALEAAANGIVIADRQGTILWVNSAFTRLTGYTAEEAIGQNPRILKSAVQAPAFYQNLWNTILSGQVWHSDEVINRRKDGTLYAEEMTITPVQQTPGEISHFIAIKQEVTERKRAEREIKRLNRLYAVLSEINQAIVRTHERQQLFEEACRVAVEAGQFRLAWIGRVDDSTHTVQILARYGHSEGDLEHFHTSLAESVSGSDDPTATAIREGRIFLSNDLEHDGSPVLWRAAAVKRGHRSLAVLPLTVSDRVWGVIHFYSAELAFFDKQETRLLEELAADLSYAVESLQRDEQRQQAEEAMRQAQKLESLGVLAGGIAHDFNNLLVAMLGQTSLAMEQLPAESSARSHIEKAVGAARRAADLTRQLLAYSGRGQFQVLPINLNTLIQENLHLFEVAIPKNVRLVSNLAESLPFIDGDVGQMQQVIMNLVINAAEAIGRNLGTVRVTTDTYYITSADVHLWKYIGSPLTSGLYVTLSVQDNGSGMDAATLSKIFDPFFTTKVTGRGLGLAAVLGIVRGHKGGLRVESEVGKGTTFTLYLPVSVAQPTTPTITDREQVPMVTHGLVLVIDDEKPVREAVTDILEAEGITVIAARDGRAGLALYRERQADVGLVLLDLSMPGLSGEETFHELRRISPNVSIILSSGYQQSEVTRRFAGQGLVSFLQKPYDVDALIQEVGRHLA
jgi:two-component system, cell cycle sensor histidine kinase and response regulator CckA